MFRNITKKLVNALDADTFKHLTDFTMGVRNIPRTRLDHMMCLIEWHLCGGIQMVFLRPKTAFGSMLIPNDRILFFETIKIMFVIISIHQSFKIILWTIFNFADPSILIRR